MRLRKLASSIAIAAIGVAAATAWRLHERESSAKTAYPPSGQLVGDAGQQVHLEVHGTGPDLVLIHGASGNLRDFTFSMVDRLKSDYRVIALDRPGHGHSDPLPDNDPSLQMQVQRLRSALTQVGVSKPILLGQSYGSAIALEWALQEKPAALVLVGGVSMPWPGELDPWYRATSTTLGRKALVPLVSAFLPKSYVLSAVEKVFAPQPAPEGYAEHLGLALTLRPSALAANVAQINALRPQVVAMEPRYHQLDLPVELIHGDADTIVPLSVHSARVVDLLPQARLTVLPGVGHVPHHTNEADVIDAIHRAAARAGLR